MDEETLSLGGGVGSPVKSRSVAVVVVVSVRDEQVGVDHLVEESLNKVLPGTELQQGHAQPKMQK